MHVRCCGDRKIGHPLAWLSAPFGDGCLQAPPFARNSVVSPEVDPGISLNQAQASRSRCTCLVVAGDEEPPKCNSAIDTVLMAASTSVEIGCSPISTEVSRTARDTYCAHGSRNFAKALQILGEPAIRRKLPEFGQLGGSDPRPVADRTPGAQPACLTR